jgi:hypothetical protein
LRTSPVEKNVEKCSALPKNALVREVNNSFIN